MSRFDGKTVAELIQALAALVHEQLEQIE